MSFGDIISKDTELIMRKVEELRHIPQPLPLLNDEYRVTQVEIVNDWMGEPKTIIMLEKKGLPMTNMDVSRVGSWSVSLEGIFDISEDSAKKKVKPEMVFYNDKKQVVALKFKDGTVVTVRPSEDDEYSREYGFLEALGKYIYGSRSALVRAIESGKVLE